MNEGNCNILHLFDARAVTAALSKKKNKRENNRTHHTRTHNGQFTLNDNDGTLFALINAQTRTYTALNDTTTHTYFAAAAAFFSRLPFRPFRCCCFGILTPFCISFSPCISCAASSLIVRLLFQANTHFSPTTFTSLRKCVCFIYVYVSI